MAPRYRRVDPRVWTDERFVSLSAIEKLIALYLMTAQSNRIGLFYFSPGMAIEQLRLPVKVFRSGFQCVLKAFGWDWDETSQVLYIDTWWKYNPPENANNVLGNLKDLDDLPSNPFFKPFSKNLMYLDERLHETFTQTLAKRSPQRSPQPSGKRSPSQDQDQDQDQEQEHRATRSFGLDVEEIREAWNNIPGVKACKSVGGTISDRIRARLKQHPESDWWANLFKQVRASDFLCGRINGSKGPFHATLDWILRPTNLDKLLAGDYDRVPSNGHGKTTVCRNRVQRAGDRFIKPCGDANGLCDDCAEKSAQAAQVTQ